MADWMDEEQRYRQRNYNPNTTPTEPQGSNTTDNPTIRMGKPIGDAGKDTYTLWEQWQNMSPEEQWRFNQQIGSGETNDPLAGFRVYLRSVGYTAFGSDDYKNFSSKYHESLEPETEYDITGRTVSPDEEPGSGPTFTRSMKDAPPTYNFENPESNSSDTTPPEYDFFGNLVTPEGGGDGTLGWTPTTEDMGYNFKQGFFDIAQNLTEQYDKLYKEGYLGEEGIAKIMSHNKEVSDQYMSRAQGAARNKYARQLGSRSGASIKNAIVNSMAPQALAQQNQLYSNLFESNEQSKIGALSAYQNLGQSFLQGHGADKGVGVPSQEGDGFDWGDAGQIGVSVLSKIFGL